MMGNYEQIKDLIESLIKKENDGKKKFRYDFITTLIILNFGLMGLIVAIMAFWGKCHFDIKIRENVSSEFTERIKEVDKRIETALLKQLHEINSLVQQNTAISKKIKVRYLDIKNQSSEWDKNVEKIINEQANKSINKALYFDYLKKGIKDYEIKSQEAIYSFKKALEYNPNDMDTLYKLARSYMDLAKDNKEACNYLQQAIESGFNDRVKAEEHGFQKFLGVNIFNELFQKN